ncbi:Beta-galactosidase [Quillaja saponaria]|uniref:beta-galactosidase n=1 Tax=Quillaja saponaria TaxID=32244 RepID=A0AAD7PP19_QUISA|nr:Beta-galactosidase [Quillaja saponaria]
MWLHNMPGIQLRTDNTVYKNEMQIFTTKVVNLCKEAKLFAPQGGPIIMAQIENEYGDVAGRYGEAGKSYIKWAAQMAVGQNIGVPWIMCKYSEAPQPMINTCNGFYCDNFTPNNPKSPKMFTENWLGWKVLFSCDILEDSKKEVYNTANINAQTSVFFKKPIEVAGQPPSQLSWMWAPEVMKDTLQGKGTFKESQLLEQKEVTVGVSDYLWYMTNVDINDTSSWKNVTLQVNTNGHGLHAYVNWRYVGSQWGKYDGLRFVLSKPTSLKQGPNVVTLLSGTVGHAHHGAYFDLQTTGIVGGPVKLIGSKSNLSTSTWSYKAWARDKLGLMGRALDAIGLQCLLATLVAVTRDYRGEYKPKKCAMNCGLPSQRWYHVPRSFLNNDVNKLVLFEEMGGNPEQVAFQTVTTGTVCGIGNEGSRLELSCQGARIISEIQFSSYGDPRVEYGAFKKGTWESLSSFSVVERACIGRES